MQLALYPTPVTPKRIAAEALSSPEVEDFLARSARLDPAAWPDVPALAAALSASLGEGRVEGIRRHLADPHKGTLVVQLEDANLSEAELVRLFVGVGSSLGRVLPELGERPSVYRAMTSVHKVEDELSPDARIDFYRNPYVRFNFHTDACYHSPTADWFGLVKLEDRYARGGDSLVLHLEDLEGLDAFRADPRGRQLLHWLPPANVPARTYDELASRGVASGVRAPVFDGDGDDLTIRCRRVASPTAAGPRVAGTPEQLAFLRELEDGVRRSAGVARVALPRGRMLFSHNRRVLHGRTAFASDPRLRRVIGRMRGWF